MEELSVDLFIREQHRPLLSTVTCCGVYSQASFSEITLWLHIVADHSVLMHLYYLIIILFITYRDRFRSFACESLAVTSSPRFRADVSLAEFGSLQVSVSAFAGQLRKIEATLSQNLSGSIRSP